MMSPRSSDCTTRASGACSFVSLAGDGQPKEATRSMWSRSESLLSSRPAGSGEANTARPLIREDAYFVTSVLHVVPE
eukprot:4792215-Prymnesium_polylepis.1